MSIENIVARIQPLDQNAMAAARARQDVFTKPQGSLGRLAGITGQARPRIEHKVATATAGDEEMKVRIENHRAERPAEWRTLEAPLNVGRAIQQEVADHPIDVILLDCMTLLATNVLLRLPENASEKEASDALNIEVEELLTCMDRSRATWIIVSNEVGLGLVPPYPLGRIYRDALSRANQRLAAHVDSSILMVAGIPIPLSTSQG